ncbi:MAG: helix-turn-helix domain-containing protein [Gemmatimonadota bacterium]
MLHHDDIDGANLDGFLSRLRQALDLRAMSQADLARALGVRQATVSDWFTHRHPPNGLVMLRLPGVLGVNAGWLFSGDGPMSGGASTHDPPG